MGTFFVEQKSLNEESQNKISVTTKESELQKRYMIDLELVQLKFSKSREKQLKKISIIEAPIAKSKVCF